MAKPYTITITDGVGTHNVLNGNYNVTSNTSGYQNESITPSSVNVVNGVNEYTFSISATGTLTLHVTEDGTAGGTSVVGAEFIRCDKNGVEYGTVVTSDASGNAIFNNVPFDLETPPNVYYIQKSSDGEHEFDATLKTTTLTNSTATLEITNTPPATRTIEFVDLNYDGLPIESGTITFN